MQHMGTLFLSRTKPQATQAKDGSMALTLLALDRIGPLQVEPYLITWTGPQAQAFWELHHAELVPGVPLQVELEALRMHTETGRHTVGKLVAAVKSLQVLPKGHNSQTGNACAA